MALVSKFCCGEGRHIVISTKTSHYDNDIENFIEDINGI